MASSDYIAHPDATVAPTASEQCRFGLIDTLDNGGAWHWRKAAAFSGRWSQATYVTMADACQAASFASHRDDGLV